MKRDLKINYGKLDDIIGELQTYEEALETMEESLEEISTLVKTNKGKSIDAWDEQLNTSKGEVKKYQEQIGDLLSLFENYVSDTTAYISPISRKAMMRVSRNNIWANLQQMEIGVEGKIANALLSSLKEPSSFLFGLLEDPTDAEQDASDYNKRQLERIEDSIQSTQSVITEKMDDLWELYNDKVKPFENTDDSYKELAADIKDDYTGFFEGLGEALMDPIKDSYDLLRGLFSGAVGLVKGVAILASDVGIVLVSSQIPDPIEPAFIKDKNDEIVEDYSNAAKQVIDNPLIVAEMFAQSVSDTVEEEGAMYATGEALTALIPVAGGLKYAKEGAVLKNAGKGNKGGKETNHVKHLDDVPRTKEIEVKFKRNDKHESEEFARQLKEQEKGMNELTVEEYLQNRDKYITEGRAIESNSAQKMARQEALKDKIAELRKQGVSRADATKQATEWLETKAALHNPDQIAGGRADIIGGFGDKRINSSIGSQWKYRIDIVDEEIRDAAKNMSTDELKNTYLNVKLIQ